MSTLNFNQNKIRPYLLYLLRRYTYLLSHSEKTFQTASLSHNNLTDASAARVKLQIIYITEFFTVPYTNHFFTTKIIQIHGFHLFFFISICSYFQNSSSKKAPKLCFEAFNNYLSSRMCFRVHLANPVMIHIRINLCGGKIRMS